MLFKNVKVKLRDLVDPDRNRTFIDNLYAQFESNSNKISLIYVNPSLHAAPNGSRLLTNQALTDTKLLNDFYMNAHIRNQAYHQASKQNYTLFKISFFFSVYNCPNLIQSMVKKKLLINELFGDYVLNYGSFVFNIDRRISKKNKCLNTLFTD